MTCIALLVIFCIIVFVTNKILNESMDPSCLVSTVQAAGGGVMVWGVFSWHTLGPLETIEHRLNTTVYLSIVLTMSIPL